MDGTWAGRKNNDVVGQSCLFDQTAFFEGFTLADFFGRVFTLTHFLMPLKKEAL